MAAPSVVADSWRSTILSAGGNGELTVGPDTLRHALASLPDHFSFTLRHLFKHLQNRYGFRNLRLFANLNELHISLL